MSRRQIFHGLESSARYEAGEYVFNDNNRTKCEKGGTTPSLADECSVPERPTDGVALGATSRTACDAGASSCRVRQLHGLRSGTYSSSRSENCAGAARDSFRVTQIDVLHGVRGWKVQPLAGQSLCASRNAGFYQAATGRAGNFCDGGKYSSSSSALSCSSCPAGSFSSTNVPAYIDCVEGRHSGEDGRRATCASRLLRPSAGSTGASQVLGATEERVVVLHRVRSCASSSTGQTSCQTCNAGEVSAIVGSASCGSCEPVGIRA